MHIRNNSNGKSPIDQPEPKQTIPNEFHNNKPKILKTISSKYKTGKKKNDEITIKRLIPVEGGITYATKNTLKKKIIDIDLDGTKSNALGGISQQEWKEKSFKAEIKKKNFFSTHNGFSVDPQPDIDYNCFKIDKDSVLAQKGSSRMVVKALPGPNKEENTKQKRLREEQLFLSAQNPFSPVIKRSKIQINPNKIITMITETPEPDLISQAEDFYFINDEKLQKEKPLHTVKKVHEDYDRKCLEYAKKIGETWRWTDPKKSVTPPMVFHYPINKEVEEISKRETHTNFDDNDGPQIKVSKRNISEHNSGNKLIIDENNKRVNIMKNLAYGMQRNNSNLNGNNIAYDKHYTQQTPSEPAKYELMEKAIGQWTTREKFKLSIDSHAVIKQHNVHLQKHRNNSKILLNHAKTGLNSCRVGRGLSLGHTKLSLGHTNMSKTVNKTPFSNIQKKQFQISQSSDIISNQMQNKKQTKTTKKLKPKNTYCYLTNYTTKYSKNSESTENEDLEEFTKAKYNWMYKANRPKSPTSECWNDRSFIRKEQNKKEEIMMKQSSIEKGSMFLTQQIPKKKSQNTQQKIFDKVNDEKIYHMSYKSQNRFNQKNNNKVTEDLQSHDNNKFSLQNKLRISDKFDLSIAPEINGIDGKSLVANYNSKYDNKRRVSDGGFRDFCEEENEGNQNQIGSNHKRTSTKQTNTSYFGMKSIGNNEFTTVDLNDKRGSAKLLNYDDEGESSHNDDDSVQELDIAIQNVGHLKNSKSLSKDREMPTKDRAIFQKKVDCQSPNEMTENNKPKDNSFHSARNISNKMLQADNQMMNNYQSVRTIENPDDRYDFTKENTIDNKCNSGYMNKFTTDSTYPKWKLASPSIPSLTKNAENEKPVVLLVPVNMIKDDETGNDIKRLIADPGLTRENYDFDNFEQMIDNRDFTRVEEEWKEKQKIFDEKIEVQRQQALEELYMMPLVAPSGGIQDKVKHVGSFGREPSANFGDRFNKKSEKKGCWTTTVNRNKEDQMKIKNIDTGHDLFPEYQTEFLSNSSKKWNTIQSSRSQASNKSHNKNIID